MGGGWVPRGEGTLEVEVTPVDGKREREAIVEKEEDQRVMWKMAAQWVGTRGGREKKGEEARLGVLFG